MKNIVILIIIILFYSCDKREKAEITNFKNKIDSLTNELNTYKKSNLQFKNKLNSKSIKEYNNEDFNRFFFSFMTDSVFQKNRIIFPLKYYTTDINLMKDTVIHIQKKDWIHKPFYINSASERTQIYDNFDLSLRRTNQRLLHWYGVETGGNSKYYFEGIKGKWFLIKKWDSGI